MSNDKKGNAPGLRASEARPGGGARATVLGICGKCGEPEGYEHARSCVWYARCQLMIDDTPCGAPSTNVVDDMGVCMGCLEELAERGERDEWGPSVPRHMWLKDRCPNEAQSCNHTRWLGGSPHNVEHCVALGPHTIHVYSAVPNEDPWAKAFGAFPDLPEPIEEPPVDLEKWIEKRIRPHLEKQCDGLTVGDCIDTIREDLAALLRRVKFHGLEIGAASPCGHEDRGPSEAPPKPTLFVPGDHVIVDTPDRPYLHGRFGIVREVDIPDSPTDSVYRVEVGAGAQWLGLNEVRALPERSLDYPQPKEIK